MQNKQLALWQKDSRLQYDNTLTKHNTCGTYSPDLSPAVLFLFLNLNVSLKRYQFGFADKTYGGKNATAANQFLKNQIHNAGKNEDITVIIVSMQEVTIFKGVTFNYIYPVYVMSYLISQSLLKRCHIQPKSYLWVHNESYKQWEDEYRYQCEMIN